MIVPEFLQEACTAEALAAETDRLLCNREVRANFLARTGAALAELVGPFASPSGEAADVVLRVAGIPVAAASDAPHIDPDSLPH